MKRLLVLLLLLPSASFAAESTRLFQVVLLRASMSGADELTTLPKNAGKAVADIRDFLPYKSYRVLDSGLLRAAERAAASLHLDQYDVRVTFKMNGANKLNVSPFTLERVHKPGTTPLPPGVAPPAPEKPPISTSFSVDAGETIVVGSSKLAGGDALVVLFTALR